jgi:hypothetical protein
MDRQVADALTGRAARLVPRQALTFEMLDAGTQMEIELLANLAGDDVAPQERAESGGENAKGAHPIPL